MAGRRGNNEGSWYFDREAERWRGAITVNRRRLYRSARTERELKVKLRDLRTAGEHGQLSTDHRLTLGNFLDTWLEDIARPRISRHTHACYSSRVRHIQRLIGHLRLADIDPTHIRRAYRNLEEAGLGARSLNAVHATLRSAMKDAVRDRKLNWNFMDAVAAPRYSPSVKRALTVEEMARFIEGTANHRYGALWHLTVTTGLRIGEAVALHWDDIDFKLGTLAVRGTVHRIPGGGREIGDTKTASSRRTVNLDEDLCAVLKTHRQHQLKERLASTHWEDLDLVFPGMYGQLLDTNTPRKALKSAMHNLSLPVLTSHELRHTFVTVMLYDLDVPAGVVQADVGHSSVSMTVGTYGHVTPNARRAASTKLRDALRDARNEVLRAEL